MKRVCLVVDGRVQGVGFRWWGEAVATRLGLRGTVRNRSDGSVEFHAQGPDEQVDELVRLVTQPHPEEGRPGRVDTWRVAPEQLLDGERSFRVVY